MIYLIDDKRKRQKYDFGWDEKKLNGLKHYLEPIYDIKELIEKSEDIFKLGNTVLYHESFLDNSLYSNEALDKRKRLEDFAGTNQGFNLVFFSGSKFNRILDSNIGHLPVSVLYLNLETFLHKAQEGMVDLRYLLFGNKPEIESELNIKLKEALATIDEEFVSIPNQDSLYLRTVKDNIQNVIENADEKILFNKDVSDAKFTEYIDEWLDNVKYDNIFLPLCFGATLSDFNGLRLATLIRCSDTINQLTNIFIYGFVGIDSLLNHECFNILKTKNVRLIPFQKLAFQKAALEVTEVFAKDELPNEIHKLKLNIPNDFDDNHAITNEWAIYKWNYTIPIPVYDKIKNVLETVENRLYFKYLQTLYPTSEFSSIKEKEVGLLNSSRGKVLLIDDNYKRGWFDIFKSLFKENDNLKLESLEINYRTLSRDQIVDAANNKIIDKKSNKINYDVIILDFRLHSTDNDEVNIDFISGMQILNTIKAFNPGIQVIIFSATHKIWNLQLLQKAGADGFIFKEGIENSLDSEFSKKNILNFLSLMEDSLKKKFLKNIFFKCDNINKQLLVCDYVDDTLFEDFLNDLKKHLKLIEISVNNIDLNDSMTLDIVFLNCYNFLEKFKNYYIKELNNQFVIGIEETEMNRYKYNSRKIINEGSFIRNTYYDSPSWFQSIIGIYLDYFQKDTFDKIQVDNINSTKDLRNDYIHGIKKSFNQKELLNIFDLIIGFTFNMKE